MQRSALARFLRRVAFSTPLLAAGCYGGQCSYPELTATTTLDDNVALTAVDVDAGTCTPATFPGDCRGGPDSCRIVMADGGAVAELHYPKVLYDCYRICRGGRRPEGLVEAPSAATVDAVG